MKVIDGYENLTASKQLCMLEMTRYSMLQLEEKAQKRVAVLVCGNPNLKEIYLRDSNEWTPEQRDVFQTFLRSKLEAETFSILTSRRYEEEFFAIASAEIIAEVNALETQFASDGEPASISSKWDFLRQVFFIPPDEQTHGDPVDAL